MNQKMLITVLKSFIAAALLLACILFLPPRLVVKPEAASHLDKQLSQWTREVTFSGSVLIAQNGVVYLNQGYGLADRALGIPNSTATRYHLASMSKQFTAMAILILQSQGKLNVQEPICNHIANCPAAWQDITIHQLLTHTSGLSPQLDTTMWNVAFESETPSDPSVYIEIAGEEPLETLPGEQFIYSNFGYVLLAQIIEEVSSQTYSDFLQKNIFIPLNMDNSGYEESSSGVAKGYTYRYAKTPVAYDLLPIADGSDQIYSTTEDLYLWDQALNTEHLLSQDKMEPMFTSYVAETDYPPFGYGYGWLVTRFLGRSLVGTAGYGGDGGFNTFSLRYPSDGLTLIVLMNQGDIDTYSMLFAIASSLFLNDLVFLVTAILFMLLLTVLLSAQKNHRVKAARVFGVLWLLLAVPLALVFARYLAEGRSAWTLLPLGLVLLYMLAKALLEIVFRINLGRNRTVHLAFLTLMCLALFSLVWIAFTIHPTWGVPVLTAFGILAVNMILLYKNEIRTAYERRFSIEAK